MFYLREKKNKENIFNRGRSNKHDEYTYRIITREWIFTQTKNK